MAKETLQRELDVAIEKWRETWKSGSIDDVMKLYTENVRVMRSGKGLIMGRSSLKSTLEQFGKMGLRDIDFVSDEICAMPSFGEGPSCSMAWQRYHEVLVRQDGSEISTIYGMMMWKKVSGEWLIDAYANCAVPPEQQNTQKLRESIQRAFDQFSETWANRDTEKLADFFSDDCLFIVPSSEKLKGKVAISQWLDKAFAKGWCAFTVTIESVLPVADIYIVSQIVHVTYPDMCVMDRDRQVVAQGGGNALMRSNGENWEICEAIWNLTVV